MSEITIPDYLTIRRRPADAAPFAEAVLDTPPPVSRAAVPRIFIKRQVSPVFGWRDGGQDFEFKDFDPSEGAEMAKFAGVALTSDEYRLIDAFVKGDHEEGGASGVIGNHLRNFRRFECIWRKI